MPNTNEFWNKRVRESKEKYGHKIVHVKMGLMPLWEYEMLTGMNAITHRAVIADGAIVRDSKENLLYSGGDKQIALQIKNDNKNSVMTPCSYLFSNYMAYKQRLSDAISIEQEAFEQL